MTNTHPSFDLITSPTAGAPGGISRARYIARELDGNFRAPHHSVPSRHIASEMALAAGGVLLLDEPAEFSRSAVRVLARLWCDMVPRVRPRIVMILRGDIDAKAQASTLARMATLFDGWNIADHRSTP